MTSATTRASTQTTPVSVRARTTPWFGFVAGVLLALIDVFGLAALGIQMTLDGSDATWAVALFFVLTFGVVGYLVGVTIRGRAEIQARSEVIRRQLDDIETVNHALADAERLAAVGAMAAGVAHEVRNPLGVIRSSASLLLEDAEPGSESQTVATFIRDEVDRLEVFVNELLDFSRPLQPKLDNADAVELSEAAAKLVAHPTTIESSGSPTVRADRDLLVSAIAAALSNANEVEAENVAIRVLGDQSDELTIEVVDDGPGLSPEARNRGLEPFFTTRAKGTGLGLAMAAKVVDAHAGRIELLEGRGLGQDGAGACVRIVLPR